MGQRAARRRVSRCIRRLPQRPRPRSSRDHRRRARACRVRDAPMNVDYASLAGDVATGLFRENLKGELVAGFRQIRESGERLPTASPYASQMAEIVSRGAAAPLDPAPAFKRYQEILLAVEAARAEVLGEPLLPS